MNINKKVLKVIYNDYMDLEKRIKKYNEQNKRKMTPRESLDIFESYYLEGVEANSRILESNSHDYYALRYILFYDFESLIIDFTNATPKIKTEFLAYTDEYAKKGEYLNIKNLKEIFEEENDMEI